MAKKQIVRGGTDERIRKLETKIKRLEKERKVIISENKTLKNALEKTEEYVISLTEDKTIVDILSNIDSSKTDKECPNCGNKKIQKTNYGEFYIESCSHKDCGYRNRIHEGRPSKT